jgi:hypothetical protein
VKSPSKYRNVRTTVDGVEFASKKEAQHFATLKLLEKVGEIRGLKLQPKYEIKVCGRHICHYFADFSYLDRSGNLVVEDVKSPITRKQPVYRIKAKLFEALMGFPIREV